MNKCGPDEAIFWDMFGRCNTHRDRHGLALCQLGGTFGGCVDHKSGCSVCCRPSEGAAVHLETAGLWQMKQLYTSVCRQSRICIAECIKTHAMHSKYSVSLSKVPLVP